MRTTIPEGHEHTSFDVADKYGRLIGATIIKSLVTVEPFHDQIFNEMTERKTYFAWVGQATRNGNSYGATQRENLCKTEGERDTAIATYLNGARKRAAKIAPKAVQA